MQGFLQNKAVLVGLISLLVAGAAWYGLTSPPSSNSALVTTGATNAPGQDLVETLLALRAVKLDGTIFTEAAFTGLTDYSTPIIPEPVGRPNPFAPLFFSSSASSSSQAAIFAPHNTPSSQSAGASSSLHVPKK